MRVSTNVAAAVAAVRRLAPLAAAVAKAVRTAMLVAAAAAAVIVAALVELTRPDSAGEIALTALAALLLAAPAVVLLVFYAALREVLELPARLRALPETAREQEAELTRAIDDARARARAPLLRLPLALWRLAGFVRSSHWLLRPYAPIAALASPPLLVGVVAALAATAIEVAVAVVLLLVVAVA